MNKRLIEGAGLNDEGGNIVSQWRYLFEGISQLTKP